jgi:hypothetical protein
MVLYPIYALEMLRVLVKVFLSIYLCDAGFSSLISLKTKKIWGTRNDLHCAVSDFNPKLDQLVIKNVVNFTLRLTNNY